ncbi:histidine kinase [Oleiphilus messinensis]|uniref:histidine kinase n=1 Tax=Oleiphilus messinensis TaxID=141451 RepID=A0A1Y0I4W0_9GAMM|nr:response regulator [Oleiphilus messinensis]ARU55451.1 histidine kinase [Oleiphilus messinensis]
MMIALLGGLGFFIYLLFNVLVAAQNRATIEDLLDHKFPVVENLLQLKEHAELFKESLTHAINLENQYLIQDSLEYVSDFQSNLNRVQAKLVDKKAELDEIGLHFQTYVSQAKALANILSSAPQSYAEYQQSAEQINATFDRLIAEIDAILDVQQEAYRLQLHFIQEDMVQANRIGTVLGITVLLGLFLWAWVISRQVLNAIGKTNRLKEAFLTTISHELRTPMNGIMGSINLLKKTTPSREQEELIDAASLSSLEMVRTVDEILTFVDFISDKPKITYKSFSLEDMLFYPLKLMCRECEKKGLLFEYDSSQFHGIVIESDEQKILHVIRRILENALKFTQRGRIKFTVRHQSLSMTDKTGTVFFEVDDSGPGIDEAMIYDIMQPFQQLDSSFSRKHGGLGIGLSICKSVAKSLGGELWIENKEEELGVRVRFSFPCKFVKMRSSAAQVRSPSSVQTIPKPAIPVTVLIVEDNKVNQMVIEKMLRRMKYNTLIANNGAEAVEQVKRHAIGCILMDCQMPVMDGFEATRQIRQLEKPKRDVPIIAVTANARESDRDKCLSVGMDSFISKPVDFKVVEKCLHDFLTMERACPDKTRPLSI